MKLGFTIRLSLLLLFLVIVPISYGFDLNLNEGWNLVSIPVVTDSTDISVVLSPIQGSFEKVIYFNSTDRKYYIYPADGLQTLDHLDNTMGFWIQMKNSDTLSFADNYESSTLISLEPGMNMIGFPSASVIPIDDFAGMLGDKALMIISYEDGEYKTWHSKSKKGTLTEIKPGLGYWIKMTDEHDLVITNSLNNPPSIDNIIITPDESPDAGVQVYPKANDIKTVYVSVLVSDPDGTSDIKNVSMQTPAGEFILSKESDIDSDTAKYTGSFDMDYFQPPGNYEVDIIAYDYSSLEASATESFEYAGLEALVFDSTVISFNNVAPGETVYVLGDTDMLTEGKGTVKNAGNVVVDTYISGSDLTGAGVIPVSNVEYQFRDEGYNIMATAPCYYDLTLIPDEKAALDFRLSVDVGTASGSYSGQVSITVTSDSQ